MKKGVSTVIITLCLTVAFFFSPADSCALIMRRTVNPHRSGNPFGVSRGRTLSSRAYGSTRHALPRYNSLGDSMNSWGKQGKEMISGFFAGEKKYQGKKSPSPYARRHWSCTLD